MRTNSWTLPIKTVSEANSSEHWRVKAHRHKQQQHFIALSFALYADKIQLPCTITLTRLAPRTLDTDNLQSAFKYIRDELSDLILPDKKKAYTDKYGRLKFLKGRADDDTRITWVYCQEKSKSLGLRIDIHHADGIDHG